MTLFSLLEVGATISNKVAMTDFPLVAFQSSLTTDAILFGVFGFLYSLFGSYSNIAGGTTRPPIVHKLRIVCRMLAVLTVFNTGLTIYALYLIYLSGALSGTQNGIPSSTQNLASTQNLVLGLGLTVTMLVIAIFSFVWAFWFMD